MKHACFASLKQFVDTAFRILCLCIIIVAVLSFAAPIILMHDIRYFSLAVEDGRQMDAHNVVNVSNGGMNISYPSSTKRKYELGYTPNQDVIVVIADSGLDLQNEQLRKLLWTNPWEIENGIDDDGNGCIDDIHGCSYGIFSNDGDVQDHEPHGTLVAGVIAGVPDEAVKIPDVNPRIHIAVVNCMQYQPYFALHCPQALDYGSWIRRRTGLPVVVNASLQWPIDPLNSWGAAIARARDAGVILVTAAGNTEGGYMRYPAVYSLMYDNVISVAAVDKDNNLGLISSKYADIGAPGGSGVKTTVIGGEIQLADGTSLSAPFVTQVVALLMQRNPNSSPGELKKMLLDTSDRRSELEHLIKEGRVLNPVWTLNSELTLSR